MIITVMMTLIRLSKETSATIIIIIFFSLLELLLWVPPVFPEKYDTKNEISGKDSLTIIVVRQGRDRCAHFKKTSQLLFQRNSNNWIVTLMLLKINTMPCKQYNLTSWT